MGIGFYQIEKQIQGIEREFNKKITDLKKNLNILKEQYGLTDEMKDHDRYTIPQWLSKKAKELFKNPENKPTKNQFNTSFQKAGIYWLNDMNKELNKKISLMQLEGHVKIFIEENFENGRYNGTN